MRNKNPNNIFKVDSILGHCIWLSLDQSLKFLSLNMHWGSNHDNDVVFDYHIFNMFDYHISDTHIWHLNIWVR